MLFLLLVLLMVMMSCNVPRMSRLSVDDVAGAPIPRGMHRYIHDGEAPVSECKHFYVEEALPTSDMWVSSVRCICVFCKSIIVREE